ncbi:MAG: 2Fe-2S iron-sulfur cluster-binding protein [Desulfobaccales bacterium]|jgi:heterodisulfide reductase subunit A
MVKLTIDDRQVEVPEGTTVLEAARKVGISIPTLCYYEAIKPYGGCRLCAVQVTQGNRTQITASCTYPVSEGLQVVTDAPRALAVRRLVIDLLWSRCSDSPELQEIARQLGVMEPSFSKGHDDCILCGKCTRVCTELQGVGAISFLGRGAKRQVTSPFGEFSQVCRTCGACAFVCPTGHIKDISKISGKVPKPKLSEFNAGLDTRGNIYRLYPQAVPSAPSIDREGCVKFLTGDCGACATACPAGAIDYEMKDEKVTLNVGAVVLAPGFQAFDPSIYSSYHYANFPNVITSLEFERILSASGPFGGHLVRPGDHQEPKKIAWLQCVGSRDLNHCDNSYCSAVCCMYAIKQTVIAKEHCKEYPLDAAIFFMDMRTHGKDFEQYYNRAREQGVRFIRSRVHSVEPVPGTDDLALKYWSEDGSLNTESFDLVVLSIGMVISPDTVKMAKKLGIELRPNNNFVRASCFDPVATSRPGVYTCGVFSGPKDIPESVMEASAAAGAVSATLGEVRWTRTKTRVVPPEIKVSPEDTPRIGVFVCNCGINIGGIVNVPELVAYSKTLPNVVLVDENLFTCSQDTQVTMTRVIEEQKLNRVVVAACTPITHEPLFRETLIDAGLNKYLFEMANIRNQDSWVHMKEPAKATEVAKDLVRMAVARASLLKSLIEKPLTITQRAVVIGGGVAGLNAALNLGDQGFETIVLEKNDQLGGNARNIHHTIEGMEVAAYLDGLIDKVKSHDNIQVLTEALVVGYKGYKGNFTTEVLVGPGMYARKIDHGITVVATGAHEYVPKEFLYGQHHRIMTQLELGHFLQEKPGEAAAWKRIAMIQCVGSRNEENPNCSRICCQGAVKSALQLKKINPETEVLILYRDMRTYGLLEDYYLEARTQGVHFVRFDLERLPEVKNDNGALSITFVDHVLDLPVTQPVDAVILSAGVRANDTEELASLLKVPRNAAGFFIEAHPKLRPVDFASEGIFLCGMAHSPKLISESIAQAQAAASRAGAFLADTHQTISGVTAHVDPDRCAACLVCVRTCPYGVPQINRENVSEINEAMCQGCGTCASECPAMVIQVSHYEDDQLSAKIKTLY